MKNLCLPALLFTVFVSGCGRANKSEPESTIPNPQPVQSTPAKPEEPALFEVSFDEETQQNICSSKGFGFVFSFPTNMVVMENKLELGTVLTLLKMGDDSSVVEGSNITLGIQKTDKSLPDCFAQFTQEVLRESPGNKIIKTDVDRINGYDCGQVEFEILYDGKKAHAKTFVFLDNGFVYFFNIISFTEWEKHFKDFEPVIRTFRTMDRPESATLL